MTVSFLKPGITFVLIALFSSALYATTGAETQIIQLSKHWNEKMNVMTDYDGLKTFCSNDDERHTIFKLLDEIHYYHDLLEEDLKTTNYNHSKRQIKRILKHMEKIDEKYHPNQFARFFRAQCELQSKTESNSDQYEASFGMYTYNGKVYVQEVQVKRYLKKLTTSIDRIKEDVEHFYMRRLIWES